MVEEVEIREAQEVVCTCDHKLSDMHSEEELKEYYQCICPYCEGIIPVGLDNSLTETAHA